jgi:hypothetical protein
MTRGLLVSVLLCSLAASAGAEDGRPPNGRGWIFGGGITGGSVGFAGAEGLAVAVGPVDHVEILLFGSGAVAERRLQVVDADGPPPEGTVHVARFPDSTAGGAVTLHGGYAFSPRAALLADAELMGSAHDGFGNAIFAAVLRYRPLRRVWIEAGPAAGDLSYGYEDTGSVSNSVTGTGFLAAGGISVLEKERWTLDVQARYGKIWYEAFQARNVSVGLSIGRVRSGKASSGKASKPAARAAAPRGAASRG